MIFTLADVIVLELWQTKVSQEPAFLCGHLQQAFRAVLRLKPQKRPLVFAFGAESLSCDQKNQALKDINVCWAKAHGYGSHVPPIHSYFKLEFLHLQLNLSLSCYTKDGVQSIRSSIENSPASTTGHQVLRMLDTMVTELNHRKQLEKLVSPISPNAALKMEEYTRFTRVFLRLKKDAVNQSIPEAFKASRPRAVRAELSEFLGHLCLRSALIKQLIRNFQYEVDAIQHHAMELMIQYTLADIKFHYYKMDACEIATSQIQVLNYGSRLKTLKKTLYSKLPSGIVSETIRVKLGKFEQKLREKLGSLRKTSTVMGLLFGLSAVTAAAFGSIKVFSAVMLMSSGYYAYDWDFERAVKLNAFHIHMQPLYEKLVTLKSRVEARAPRLMFKLDQKNAHCHQ